MLNIKVVRTITYAIALIILMSGSEHVSLAAKFSPKQAQLVDNNIQNSEEQIATINLRDGLRLPNPEVSGINNVLPHGNVMLEKSYQENSTEKQNLIKSSNTNVIAHQNLMNIAIRTFLRVMGVVILIYGLGMTAEAVFRNSK